jgi:hypothetical protein
VPRAAKAKLVDATIYAHLLPLDAGLRLQFLQRPLSEGSWLPLGHRLANIVAISRAQRYNLQAIRKIRKKRLNKLIEACPSLADAEVLDGEQEWQIEYPDVYLELFSELKTQPGPDMKIAWPKGERMYFEGAAA